MKNVWLCMLDTNGSMIFVVKYFRKSQKVLFLDAYIAMSNFTLREREREKAICLLQYDLRWNVTRGGVVVFKNKFQNISFIYKKKYTIFFIKIHLIWFNLIFLLTWLNIFGINIAFPEIIRLQYSEIKIWISKYKKDCETFYKKILYKSAIISYT